MPTPPQVDVNLFVHDGEATVGAAIESVLAQTWPAIRLTLIDDGSTDGTPEILRRYARQNGTVRLQRTRVNAGAIASFQRAFWLGDADFVLPKSGDDVLAPDFVAKAMGVLLAHPDCAMCHAAGLIFSGDGEVRGVYPDEHRLQATGADSVARAAHVMARYTSAPSFWGIYRRYYADLLAPIRYRAGWDHALIAELALYGEIRHVPETLYWRRDGGKPVAVLARAATEQGSRRLPVDRPDADQRWRTPLITTAYAHIETFALARVPEFVRRAAAAAVSGDLPRTLADAAAPGSAGAPREFAEPAGPPRRPTIWRPSPPRARCSTRSAPPRRSCRKRDSSMPGRACGPARPPRTPAAA